MNTLHSFFSQLAYLTKPPELAEFALIQGGEFTMGDTLDGNDDAIPHTVNVSTYYLQTTAVSKSQWNNVRTWGLKHGYSDLSAGDSKAAADHPVQTVSWFDVVKWCNAKSEMAGLNPCYLTDAGEMIFRTGKFTPETTLVKWDANGYRLPTEAEWEKAARGGLSGKRFPWGDAINFSQANFENTGGETYQTGRVGNHPKFATSGYPYTSPVGSFAMNDYGLYDMAGNVWEWCWDWYDRHYYDISPPNDPRGPASGSSRIMRGGFWGGCAKYCRVADRYHTKPESACFFVGFRPARSTLR
jgi:sulfatase modifying factor 1